MAGGAGPGIEEAHDQDLGLGLLDTGQGSEVVGIAVHQLTGFLCPVLDLTLLVRYFIISLLNYAYFLPIVCLS